jgi:hypothetical protein
MGQLTLPLKVQISKEVDGLEMGVLSDGTTYLSGRSLAKLCGVVPSAIINQSSAWANGQRVGRLAQLLTAAGIDRPSLFMETDIPGVAGNAVHAYPEDICMIFLEYYAFDIGRVNEQAQNAYRTLARAGVRAFVYRALGYDPANAVPQPWREFHDRLSLYSEPLGYFGVFKEMSSFLLVAIQAGLRIDHRTIPDISVGKLWGERWSGSGAESRFGPRIKHEHNYPPNFPQARSNPQDIWVYPVAALGDFRLWLHNVYIPERLPAYLETKVNAGLITATAAELLLTHSIPPEPLQLAK